MILIFLKHFNFFSMLFVESAYHRLYFHQCCNPRKLKCTKSDRKVNSTFLRPHKTSRPFKSASLVKDNNRWVLQCGLKCHYLGLCQTNAENELDEK